MQEEEEEKTINKQNGIPINLIAKYFLQKCLFCLANVFTGFCFDCDFKKSFLMCLAKINVKKLCIKIIFLYYANL